MQGFDEESLSELYNALLLFRSKGQKMSLGKEIDTAAYEAWNKEMLAAQTDQQELKIQDEVCEILKDMKIKYSIKFSDKKMVLPIDIVIDKKKKIGLNIAGSQQYTCTKPYKPTGTLVSSQWVYEKQGWKVTEIPFYLWEQQKSEEMKKTYIKELLQG
eukprot:TRINITY_DN29966_c0_g2_i1.p3 TRINITY_DN29966_c0_g2~~TRINITY_DN29966_c0_g2_i1.p3  ORF type:complete len:158 (+),score=24.85 TRINITY_DN29966_c0_g2_i1:103-576(+)